MSVTRRATHWRVLGASAAFAAAGCVPTAFAAGVPARPIRMVVPLPPGTASDFLARTLGAPLAELYRQQVVVDNRAGAGGLIGSGILAQATPDGYTLGLIGPPHLAGPLLQAKPPYRAIEDFTPVMQVALIANVLVVSPAVGARSMQELVAAVRGKPGGFNFASAGVGTSAHLSVEIFNRAAGLKAVHVPFKSMADVYTEMLAGRVHYYVFTAPASMPMLRDGKLKALAVTTPKRSVALPDVPTIAEAGLAAAQTDSWFGIAAPAKTPAAVVERLRADLVKVLNEADIRERFARQGAEPTPESTPVSFGRLLRNEYERYRTVIREAGIKAP